MCGIDTGKAGTAATIRVLSDRDPVRRTSETLEFGATKREVLALAPCHPALIRVHLDPGDAYLKCYCCQAAALRRRDRHLVTTAPQPRDDNDIVTRRTKMITGKLESVAYAAVAVSVRGERLAFQASTEPIFR